MHQTISDEALQFLHMGGVNHDLCHLIVNRSGSIQNAAQSIIDGSICEHLPNIKLEKLRNSLRNTNIAQIRKSANSCEAQIVTIEDEQYPWLLRPLPSPPLCLWYLGDIQTVHQKAISVVGSRRSTAYGESETTRFVNEFQKDEFNIVSGGARGIDRVAHEASLRVGGKTICVLGSGLNKFYPPEHKSLFQQIRSSGGLLLSEFSSDTSPKPLHFPRRNRIIAGLGSSLLVVEAAIRSGALITARIAVEEHGRQVFAVPGRNDSSVSQGCNKAISDAWVGVAIDPSEIVNQANQTWKHLSSMLINNVGVQL